MVRGMVIAAINGSYTEMLKQNAGAFDVNSIMDTETLGNTYYQVDCTFPNATKVEEIQEAILTLPNMVPQYAYKY